MNQFVPPDDPILTKPDKKIPKTRINSVEIKEIVEFMLKIAYGEQQDRKKPVMVGLAAPQIGILKRIILVDLKANGKGKVGDLRVYINPEIIWKSKKEAEWYEGCYSTSKVCGIVSRPTSIKIRAYILGFKPSQPLWVMNLRLGFEAVEEKHSGYVGRIFQHEIDHLNGIRFPDLIKDPGKLHWVEKNEFPLYRNKKMWKNWPKKCSFDKWNQLKNPLLKQA